MKIKLNSVYINDQDQALKFYTEILGFIKKTDLPAGKYKWLTVVSPEEPEGTELVLEPNVNQDAKAYQSALYQSGIPITSFAVEDIQAEHKRLTNMGVVFQMKPTEMGTTTVAVFDDTCGNYIQIYQV